MSRKIKLPISLESDITSGSGSYAYVIAQVESSDKKTENFLCNSYINCYFDNCYFDIYEQDYNFINDKLLDIKYCDSHTYLVLEKTDQVIEVIYEYLERGYFLYKELSLDFHKMFGYEKKQDNNKYCVIYGIDMDNSRINIFSIYNRKFLDYSITFEEFKDALDKTERPAHSFDFKKVNPDYDDSINLPRIIDDFNDYMNSKCRKKYFDNNRVYGIESTLAMRDFVIGACDEILSGADRKLPIIDMYTLNDHKKLMYRRLLTLENAGYLTSEGWSSKYIHVKNLFDRLVTLCEKFIENPSESLKQIMIILFNTSYNDEKEIVTELCERGVGYEAE